MAKPAYYPDWANLTVTLPGTGNTNKIRPKETIRTVGMDFGQIMTCEEMNWVLNNIGLWVHYIIDEVFPTLPNTYLPMVGTKITMAGDATGTVTWNGTPDVTLSIQVVDNSHSHTSANISDATVTPTANVLVKRDTNGSMYAGNYMYIRALGSATTANMILQNAGGTQLGYVQATIAGSGYLNIARNDPSNGGTPAQVILYDQGYVLITSPRSNSGQDTGNGNALVRLDYLNSRLTSLQNTLQTNINTVNTNLTNSINSVNSTLTNRINNVESNLQGQITNNLNYLNGNFARGIRFGARQTFKERNLAERLGGGVMTSWADYGDSNYWVGLRPVQYSLNGNWVTAGYT